jgi:hypothetical protein
VRYTRYAYIKLDCEFCKGPILANPHVFKFANYERFFCCTGCMARYRQKYAGRIESIKRKFLGKELDRKSSSNELDIVFLIEYF